MASSIHLYKRFDEVLHWYWLPNTTPLFYLGLGLVMYQHKQSHIDGWARGEKNVWQTHSLANDKNNGSIEVDQVQIFLLYICIIEFWLVALGLHLNN